MKVTIISNGTHQIVLKPETPLEILAIKELENKPLISKYHNSTQILEVSSPNCLVISTANDKNTLKPEIRYVAVIDCYQQNKIIGLIPSDTPPSEILYFLKQKMVAEKVEILKGSNIIIDKSFQVEVTSIRDGKTFVDTGEFAIMDVQTFNQW